MRKLIYVLGVLGVAGLIWVVFLMPVQRTFSGDVFGTTYTIKVVGPRFRVTESIQDRIMGRFRELDSVFSTYRQDSDISKFNASQEGGDIGRDFSTVFLTSRAIYQKTNGAFDPSVKRLVELWHFGASDRLDRHHFPSQDELHDSLRYVGLDLFSLQGQYLSKQFSESMLDFSAIAKGYAVDAVAHLLEGLQLYRYFVEIGGEVRVRGERLDGKPWVIGVEKPQFNQLPPEAGTLIRPLGNSVATSGVYRQWFNYEGKRLSHIIDPRTGYPTTSQVVSATVIYQDCLVADALATALVVMDVEEGMAVIESIDGAEALWMVYNDNEALDVVYSSHFDRFLWKTF